MLIICCININLFQLKKKKKKKKNSQPPTFNIPNEGMLPVTKTRWLSSNIVWLKLSSAMLTARITGYLESSPFIFAMLRTVSPAQFSTILQNVAQVVFAPLKSIERNRLGLHWTAMRKLSTVSFDVFCAFTTENS